MDVTFKPCETDDDYASASRFFLEHKYDLHPSFSTLDMVSLLYSYINQGCIHRVLLPDGRIIGASAYYHGTPERGFADKEVALIDIVILERAYRGTRTFLYGLKYFIGWIRQRHPEVEEVRLAALSDNAYLCKLYSKFASPEYKREGSVGEETVFCEKIHRIEATLKKFHRV